MLALNWLQEITIAAGDRTTQVFQLLPEWTEEVGCWIRSELIWTRDTVGALESFKSAPSFTEELRARCVATMGTCYISHTIWGCHNPSILCMLQKLGLIPKVAELCRLQVHQIVIGTLEASFSSMFLNSTPELTEIVTTGGVVNMETANREKRGGSAAGQNSTKVFELGPKAAETFFFRIPKIF